ncbi:hypothetical protein FIU82_05930 [Pseudoalteromonas sp. THAF3]|nr:hypothetical protein FIU82_05930 [Pseudoalteromonas sp. THAF3]
MTVFKTFLLMFLLTSKNVLKTLSLDIRLAQ